VEPENICGKLIELTRKEGEDKIIVMLMKYNIQNGFLNWGKLEMRWNAMISHMEKSA